MVLLAPVGCGSSPQPSSADEVAAGARLTLENSGLVVTVEIRSDELDFDATEYVDLADGQSLLVPNGGESTALATDALGAVYLASDVIDMETDGRWLELSTDEIADGATNLSRDYGDLSGLILRGGLTSRWLAALAYPGETTLIGREVVRGQATSHYLTEPIIEGAAVPVEAWVADDGPIAQIRYLTTNDVGGAVEVTAMLSIGTGSPERGFPAAGSSVTRAELAKEAEPPAAPDIDPTPAEAVTVEMVGDALESYLASGVQTEGVFTIPSLEQICLGISDVVENGFSESFSCQRLLSPELQAVLCPTVVSFADALVSQPRTAVADAVNRMASALDGYSELGLVSGWSSFTPDEAAGESPLENSESSQQDLPIRATIERIQILYTQEFEPGYWLSEENTHDMLGVTCGVELDVNFDLFDQPPPSPNVAVDPLLAFLPMSVGDEGPAVAQMQRLLIISGESLFPDGADGQFGPGTKSTVESFQSANSLPVTGIVDQLTLARLRSIEGMSGAAPFSPTDPACPTLNQFKSSMTAAWGDLGTFNVSYILCTGEWATGVYTVPEFADGEVVLLQLVGSQWVVVGSASGPDDVCEMHAVPLDRRAPLGC